MNDGRVLHHQTFRNKRRTVCSECVSECVRACVRACVLSVCADDGGSVDKQEEKRKRRKRRKEPHAPKREEYKRLWRCDVAVV